MRSWLRFDGPPAADRGQRGVLGPGHTCALLDTGAMRCWGAGSDGWLGYGSLENVGDDETPASVGDVPLF